MFQVALAQLEGILQHKLGRLFLEAERNANCMLALHRGLATCARHHSGWCTETCWPDIWNADFIDCEKCKMSGILVFNIKGFILTELSF